MFVMETLNMFDYGDTPATCSYIALTMHAGIGSREIELKISGCRKYTGWMDEPV